MNLRPGIKLLEDRPGTGPAVERQRTYVMRFRIRLSRGDIVRFSGAQNNEDDGFHTLAATVNRESLIGGIFQTIDGMKVGGFRKVMISPHLAYGEFGVPGTIPPNARLTVEIEILHPG